jgi:polyisoprenoid-binding protein YceI
VAITPARRRGDRSETRSKRSVAETGFDDQDAAYQFLASLQESRSMRRFVLALSIAAAAAAVPLAAQMRPNMLHGAGTPADVKAGTYAVEPNHTQVAFSVSHMGISPFNGWFHNASGTLRLDPADPGKTMLSVTIPVNSVTTTSSQLVQELNSPDWFDTAKYPNATFTSIKVTKIDDRTARIDGNLTLHGVTHPETITARFFGAATNPMSKKASIGFLGHMVIKRSDFGVTKYVPLVSDETVLTINAAFERQ